MMQPRPHPWREAAIDARLGNRPGEAEVARCLENAVDVEPRLKILGNGGGYILAPCHVLQTDVATENILAMSDAGMEFGRYT